VAGIVRSPMTQAGGNLRLAARDGSRIAQASRRAYVTALTKGALAKPLGGPAAPTI